MQKGQMDEHVPPLLQGAAAGIVRAEGDGHYVSPSHMLARLINDAAFYYAASFDMVVCDRETAWFVHAAASALL